MTPGLLTADLDPIRSQKEVASILGISPARVCQHERSALRRGLDADRVRAGAAMVVGEQRIRGARRFGPEPAHRIWLRIGALVGNGIFPPEAVCYAFNERRMLHEPYYRPPIVCGNQVGYASATALENAALWLQICWTRRDDAWKRAGRCRVELEVVIMHDVPVIAAGVVVAPAGIAAGAR